LTIFKQKLLSFNNDPNWHFNSFNTVPVHWLKYPACTLQPPKSYTMKRAMNLDQEYVPVLQLMMVRLAWSLSAQHRRRPPAPVAKRALTFLRGQRPRRSLLWQQQRPLCFSCARIHGQTT
jgi:hypothetical protein